VSELSDEARALLREASAEHTPSPEQLRALDQALSLELGTVLAAPPWTRPEAMASKGVLAAKATLLKVAALCAAAAAATLVTLQPSPSARTPAVREPVAVILPPSPAREPPPPQRPVEEHSAPAVVKPARRTKRAPPILTPPPLAAPGPEQGDALGAEVELLRDARELLAQGRASSALQRLDVHTQRFGRGALQQEQLALRALCLCALGRADAARASARQLALQAPHSPQLTRLAHSCAAKE
jgi:hypothetical protein